MYYTVDNITLISLGGSLVAVGFAIRESVKPRKIDRGRAWDGSGPLPDASMHVKVPRVNYQKWYEATEMRKPQVDPPIPWYWDRQKPLWENGKDGHGNGMLAQPRNPRRMRATQEYIRSTTSREMVVGPSEQGSDAPRLDLLAAVPHVHLHQRHSLIHPSTKVLPQ